MLKLENIHKTFHAGTVNQKIALDGLSLTLNDGDFVTVIGGNGAGKSTLLNTIAGTFPVDSGTITIDGEDITDLSEEKRARFLGRVFQDPMMGTAADMWIEENMALAAPADRENFRRLLSELDLGLEDRLSSKVGLLSGGQRQALTLLMAVMKKPKVLLLDEHTAALDPKTAAKVNCIYRGVGFLIQRLCQRGKLGEDSGIEVLVHAQLAQPHTEAKPAYAACVQAFRRAQERFAFHPGIGGRDARHRLRAEAELALLPQEQNYGLRHCFGQQLGSVQHENCAERMRSFLRFRAAD